MKKFTFFSGLILITFFATTNVKSQWSKIGPPGGLPVWNVAIDTAGGRHNVFAVNDKGLYRSTDYGNSWLPNMNIAPGSVPGGLLVKSNYVFYEGFQNDFGLYRSSDHGDTWSYIPIWNLPVSSLTANVNYIFAAVSTYWGVYHSTDNGNSWLVQNPWGNSDCSAVTASGTTIFAGTDINSLYVSLNNGVNWTETSLINQSIINLTSSPGNVFAGTLYNGL